MREKAEKELLHAIGEIEDRYVEEALPGKEALLSSELQPENRPSGKENILYLGKRAGSSRKKMVAAAAACVLFLAGAGGYQLLNQARSGESMESAVLYNAELGEEAAVYNAEIKKEAAAAQESVPEIFPASGQNSRDASTEMQEPKNAEAAEGSGMQIGNPFIACDTIEQAAEIAGFSLEAPEEYGGYRLQSIYAVQKDMIELIYSDQNGEEGFRIRKSSQQGDISGDYTEYPETWEHPLNGASIELRGEPERVSVASWRKGGFSYAVLAGGAELPEKEMLALTEKIE